MEKLVTLHRQSIKTNMSEGIELQATRKIVSLKLFSGFMRTQCVKFKAERDHNSIIVNKQGNLRGMNEVSQKNLKIENKEGFGKYSQQNLMKCIAIFTWGCRMSKGINPATKKSGYMAAGFITLTIPDLHEIIDSKKGYEKLLKEFIKWLCRTYGVTSYVWKFEWQKRGQGHWHIFTDKYCDVGEVRREWLRKLSQVGLTDDWKKKFTYAPAYACKVKGLKSERQVLEYMQKYMAKNNQNEARTEGRVWGASLWIKKSKAIILPCTEEFLRTLEIAVQCKVFVKMSIDVPQKDFCGNIIKNYNGEERVTSVGISFWSEKWKPDILMCQEQRIVYDKFIKAYRDRDWKATHRLVYDWGQIKHNNDQYWEAHDDIDLYHGSIRNYSQIDSLPKREHIRRKSFTGLGQMEML